MKRTRVHGVSLCQINTNVPQCKYAKYEQSLGVPFPRLEGCGIEVTEMNVNISCAELLVWKHFQYSRLKHLKCRHFQY